MKTTKTLIKTAICLIVLLSLTAPAALARRGGGPRGAHPPSLEHLIDGLGLTEDQRRAVQQLMAARHEGRESDLDPLKAAHRGLREAIHAESVDEQTIRDAAAALAALTVERALAQAAFLQELRAILTPEQFAQLERHRDTQRHHSQGRHGDPDTRPRRGLEG